MWRTALLVLCVLARGAAAEPHQVKIRAQTRIVLDRVRLLGDDQAEVRGQLVDGLTGDGLANQAIAIQIGDETAHATTGPDGHFRIAVPRIATGPQAIDLAFRGSDLMEPAQLNQVTDPARAQVVLTIETADAPGGLSVTVRGTADDHAVDLPIDLSVGPPSNGALKPLAQVKTGAAFLVTRKAAGGPGAHRIRADFAGDDARQAAHVERSIELTAASVTTMTLSAARIAFEDDLVVTGKVTDEDGPPIHRAAVTLTSGDRRLAQGATGEDGSYRFRVEGEVLGQGQWGLQVSADPGRPSIRPSRSAPEIVRVSTPQPVPVSYTIAAFLATAAAAGGFFAARARPWNKLRRPALPAEMPANGAQDEAVEGGLVVARPGLVSTLRRASDEGFSGVVRDAVRGRPVANAVVRLERRSRENQDDKREREALERRSREGQDDKREREALERRSREGQDDKREREALDRRGREDQDDKSEREALDRRSREDQEDRREREARAPHGSERTATAGPDGGFAFEALAMGDWSASVTASGHVTETFTVSIPHRGELRGVRVDLVPVRERVFQLYRRAAEPILPEARLWGVWSPRQIVDHIRSKRPSPALADLTDFVEEVYFSPRVCEETVLPTASERVDRAIQERAHSAS